MSSFYIGLLLGWGACTLFFTAIFAWRPPRLFPECRPLFPPQEWESLPFEPHINMPDIEDPERHR